MFMMYSSFAGARILILATRVPKTMLDAVLSEGDVFASLFGMLRGGRLFAADERRLDHE
jgi:hypothetical protein